MLLKQPVEDTFRGVPLLAWGVQIGPQYLVDHRFVRVQTRRA